MCVLTEKENGKNEWNKTRADDEDGRGWHIHDQRPWLLFFAHAVPSIREPFVRVNARLILISVLLIVVVVCCLCVVFSLSTLHSCTPGNTWFPIPFLFLPSLLFSPVLIQLHLVLSDWPKDLLCLVYFVLFFSIRYDHRFWIFPDCVLIDWLWL